MSENLDEIIKVLTKNQEVLDSKKKIKLRKFMADLNFSLLSIFERIKENIDEAIKEKPLSSPIYI